MVIFQIVNFVFLVQMIMFPLQNVLGAIRKEEKYFITAFIVYGASKFDFLRPFLPILSECREL